MSVLYSKGDFDMNKETDAELYNAEIPGNVLSNSYPLGIHVSHWIETTVFITIADYIIWHIGFVEKVKWIFLVVITVSFMIIFLRGIKSKTYVGVLISAITGLKRRKEYHLGGINNDRKAAELAQYSGQSGAQQITSFIRSKASAFDRRYSAQPEESTALSQKAGRKKRGSN